MPIFVYVNEIFITSYLPIVFITLNLFVKIVKEDVLFKNVSGFVLICLHLSKWR